MLSGLARHFGRITPEHSRNTLIEEARNLVMQHEVRAMQFAETAARSALDARHHEELAAHYRDVIDRLSTQQPKDMK